MHADRALAFSLISLQGQGEDMAVQLNEEEQLLVITRLHQVPFWGPSAPVSALPMCLSAPPSLSCAQAGRYIGSVRCDC